MVGARLDYCNAILHGTSNSVIQKLQRAQNSIARIVTGTRRSEHITPVLAWLHWFKIAELIEYKVSLLTFKGLTTRKPDYLSDQLQLCAPVRQLRSSDRKNRLYLNSHWTTFASWAFCNAAPVIWNSLPHHLTDDLSCPASFRLNLKTHLQQIFPSLTAVASPQLRFVNLFLTDICCVTSCLIIIININHHVIAAMTIYMAAVTALPVIRVVNWSIMILLLLYLCIYYCTFRT